MSSLFRELITAAVLLALVGCGVDPVEISWGRHRLQFEVPAGWDLALEDEMPPNLRRTLGLVKDDALLVVEDYGPVDAEGFLYEARVAREMARQGDLEGSRRRLFDLMLWPRAEDLAVAFRRIRDSFGRSQFKEQEWIDLLNEVAKLPDQSVDELAKKISRHGPNREIASATATNVGNFRAVELLIWNRIDHGDRERKLCFIANGDLLVLRVAKAADDPEATDLAFDSLSTTIQVLWSEETGQRSELWGEGRVILR